MTVEHIINRIERLANIIELDAKQESTKQYAQSIRSLTQLARKGIEADRRGSNSQTTNN